MDEMIRKLLNEFAKKRKEFTKEVRSKHLEFILYQVDKPIELDECEFIMTKRSDYMKVRKGFVSNSSSSSFIIALPRKPESANDLLTMLKLDNPEDCIPDYYEDKDKPTVNNIIDYIIGKIEKEATDEEVAEFISDKAERTLNDIIYKHTNRYFNVECKYPDIKKDIIDYFNNPTKYGLDDMPMELDLDLLNKNKKRFIFELSDNDSPEGSCAEHGEWFKYIPYLSISNH